MSDQKNDKVRERDKPRTMEDFVKAVGTLLTEKGFNGLTVGNLAKRAGKDGGGIKKYFGSMEGLLRAYIDKIDPWNPFFDLFNLAEGADIDDIQELFTTMLQTCMKFFTEDVPTQDIILWQMSQHNELLTEISEAREVRAEQLLAATDAAFEFADINFRVVVAMLVGGIYTLILHARFNKSTFCSVDLNQEYYQMEVLKTMAQVIDLVCAKAKNKEIVVKDVPMIATQLKRLGENARQILAHPAIDPGSADIGLKSKCNKLAKAIPVHVATLETEVQIATFLEMVLNRLTKICNSLYDGKRRDNPDAVTVLALMEDINNDFYAKIPLGIVLPHLFCRNRSAEFNLVWQDLKAMLRSVADPFQLDIIAKPVVQFSQLSVQLHWSDYLYLKRYLEVLGQLGEQVTGKALFEVLIGMGFNYSRFTAWYTGELLLKLDSGGAVAAKKLLREIARWLHQVQVYSPISFDPLKVPVKEELLSWLKAETEFRSHR